MAYANDMQRYESNYGMIEKPDVPENVFNVSMIPWSTFDGFKMCIRDSYTHSLSNALVDIALRGHQMTVTDRKSVV